MSPSSPSFPSSPSSASSPKVPPHQSHPKQSSRPKAHTAATVIPSFRTSERHQNTTNPGLTKISVRPQSSTASQNRSHTISNPHPPPLQLDLASLGPISPPSEKPSSPIPIPPRQKIRSPPTTPLTARAPPPNYEYFGLQQDRPHISQSLTPYYTMNPAASNSSQPTASSPVVQRGFAAMTSRSGPTCYDYTPTSPLSPTLPPRSSLSITNQRDRPPAKDLRLAGLPKFHPAKFPSKDSNVHASPSNTSRLGPSQARSGRGSDARQKLHQYQRDIVASATKASRSSPASGNLTVNPSVPRLTPLESPVDQMTPLALEGQGDYFVAAASSSPTGYKEGDGRDMVERIVRLENERRNCPEASPGSISPAVSPAVSPAGGRG